ncbi:PhzF family phenazine biosynthesis protein [uncultured Hymenobacter sp.]|uniref:PhzF family phenazine biosynthesis protein n=1 Tax=uncultured Hymenobacter sp. TaxID=170016 RepID=UPI0035CB4FA8
MRLPLYQIDAFARRPFAGNPAAVCPLPPGEWISAELMQRIAAENNLAETAFFRPSAARPGEFDLRWFTPTAEIDLCGHATLASAHVLFQHLDFRGERITFHTLSGPLHVRRQAADGRLTLDFPSRPPQPLPTPPPELKAALGGAVPTRALAARDLVAVFATEAEVQAIQPDFAQMLALDYVGIIATAPGADADTDFVSRFFGPRVGVPEDPVTGSAHSSLIPFWAEELGRTTLKARQISARGGELWCALHGERVDIGGYAVTYLRGEIELGAQ